MPTEQNIPTRQNVLFDLDILKITELARRAGEVIMEVYQSDDFETEIKADDSPVTIADKRANELIVTGLQALAPDTPILAEESKNAPYEERSHWTSLWLVDPLDGTKEFIKRRNEFTVNIALVFAGRPVLGVIYAPALDRMYWGKVGHGAWRQFGADGPIEEITDWAENASQADAVRTGQKIRVVGSRSHHSEAMTRYMESLQGRYKTVEFVPAGSALKLCLIAEGSADLYPRLAPTMEWDSAAGHAILRACGREVLQFETGEPLAYNKPDLLNPWFICR